MKPVIFLRIASVITLIHSAMHTSGVCLALRLKDLQALRPRHEGESIQSCGATRTFCSSIGAWGWQ